MDVVGAADDGVPGLAWRAIPEPLLVRVIDLLLRPTPEIAEIVTLLNHLPPTEVDNVHRHNPIGFGTSFQRVEPENDDAREP